MLEYFAAFYFLIPIQILLSVVFIILAFANFKKIAHLKLLIIYAFLSLAQCLFGIYENVFKYYSAKLESEIETSISVFMLAEYVIFTSFIISSTKTKTSKFLLKIVLFLFSFAMSYYWLISDSLARSPSYLTIAESFIIILGCLIYFYEMFNSPPTKNIFNHPPFWIISGILVLFSFLIPLSLQLDSTYKYEYPTYFIICSINYIGYIILYAFLLIGLRCQIKAKTS